MITRRGTLYVIHAGVTVEYDDGELTLTQDDRTITTRDPEFIEGVLVAAIRQGVLLNAKSSPVPSPKE